MYKITNKNNEVICDNIKSKIMAYRIGRSIGNCYVIKDGGIVFEFTNEEREKENLIYLLDGGFSFDFGKVSICTIHRRLGDKYQVHSEHYKCNYSELFDKPEIAVNKFFEVKKKVYGQNKPKK